MRVPPLEPRRRAALLAACFFGSGVTALIYELLWVRKLQLVFGSTTYSVTTVLTAFMAGLGLGAHFLGRRVEHARAGLRLYAYLELAIALYALVSLPLLQLTEVAYLAIQRVLHLEHAGGALLKFALSFPVLAIPAAMMGGTLPALVRAVVSRRSELHQQLGRLYGLNTLGATVGTLVAGTLLVEHLGLYRSVFVTAALNLGVGLVALRLLKREPATESEAEQPPDNDPTRSLSLGGHLRRPAILFCAASIALTGFISMGYEVVWTRLLGLLVGSTTYAFTIVLTIFLFGIGAGSLIFSRWSRGRTPSAASLVILLLVLSTWVAVSERLVPRFPHLLIELAQLTEVDWGRMLAFQVLFALALLAVPTLVLGAALPLAMGIVTRTLGRVGRDLGGMYLLNTAAAVLGSALTGLALIPWIGSRRTLLVLLCMNLALAGVGAARFLRAGAARWIGVTLTLLLGVSAVARPPWPDEVFESGLGFRLNYLSVSNRAEARDLLLWRPSRRLFSREGVNATIAVRQTSSMLALLINGKPDAGTGRDMSTQVLLGALPALVHPAPKRIAVIGWGAGVSVHTATTVPGVEHVDAIEIEQAVLDASRFFHDVNGAAERDPRVRLIIDDARAFLSTTARKYDVIISEPSNPSVAGVASLFTSDFYDTVKRRLAPGAVFCQWLQLYKLRASTVALVFRTVLESFRDVQLWTPDGTNVLVLGSQGKIRLTPLRVAAAYAKSRRLRVLMGAYGSGADPENLYGSYLLDRRGLRAVVDRYDTYVLSDDRPTLEFLASRDLFEPTHLHIVSLLTAKHALGLGHPPGAADVSAGKALAGLLAILPPRAQPTALRLAEQRFAGDHSWVTLERARWLSTVGRSADALRLASTVVGGADIAPALALVRARALLDVRRPAEALRALETLGDARAVARMFLTLRAQVDSQAWEPAFSSLKRLFAACDRADDPDAVGIDRKQLYRLAARIMKGGRLQRRMAEYLGPRRERQGAEVDRIEVMVSAMLQLGRKRDAARLMDERSAFGALDRQQLRACIGLNRELGRSDRVARCRALLEQLPAPRDRPLWPLGSS